MRIIVITLLMFLTLQAKTIGVVIVDNATLDYSDGLKSKIETLFKKQAENFKGKETLEVFIDRDKKVEALYHHEGAGGVISYAKKKAYNSIALVKYKRSSKMLSITVFVANEAVQDRKSISIAFSRGLQRELPSTILSGVLSLNYELGVLNVKTIY